MWCPMIRNYCIRNSIRDSEWMKYDMHTLGESHKLINKTFIFYIFSELIIFYVASMISLLMRTTFEDLALKEDFIINWGMGEQNLLSTWCTHTCIHINNIFQKHFYIFNKGGTQMNSGKRKPGGSFQNKR